MARNRVVLFQVRTSPSAGEAISTLGNGTVVVAMVVVDAVVEGRVVVVVGSTVVEGAAVVDGAAVVGVTVVGVTVVAVVDQVLRGLRAASLVVEHGDRARGPGKVGEDDGWGGRTPDVVGFLGQHRAGHHDAVDALLDELVEEPRALRGILVSRAHEQQ